MIGLVEIVPPAVVISAPLYAGADAGKCVKVRAVFDRELIYVRHVTPKFLLLCL